MRRIIGSRAGFKSLMDTLAAIRPEDVTDSCPTHGPMGESLETTEALGRSQGQWVTGVSFEVLVGRDRRRRVGDNVRLTHRLSGALKNSCPHVRPWVHDRDTGIVGDVLAQWPTLQALQRARRATLERCCRDHHVRSAEVITQRLDALTRATPLTTDEGVSTPKALVVQALVAHRRGTWHALAEFDTAMAHRAQRPPDVPLFDALPGAGAVVAPRLLVACGEHRDRYASADELPQYAGMAPVAEGRGHTTWGHWRLQGPTCLRHTVVERAAESTRHAVWARADDQQPRAKGAAHPAAVRALACNWMRSLRRCWQTRTRDEEAISLKALQRRGAPRLHSLAQGS